MMPNTSWDRQITGILTVNRAAATVISALRPNLSARYPANKEESTLPNSTAATTWESWEGLKPAVCSM